MKLPSSAHTAQPWRIHEITPDFRLEDVWAIPGAQAHDFPAAVQALASFDPANASPVVRLLFAVRLKLGELFGWDDATRGLGGRVPTLRDRLPPDLRDAPTGPDLGDGAFRSLYLLDDEWAAEIANQTVHAVLHLGRVSGSNGGSRVQLAILVKPNGRLGRAYVAAIKPFRHVVVYPQLLRQIGQEIPTLMRTRLR